LALIGKAFHILDRLILCNQDVDSAVGWKIQTICETIIHLLGKWLWQSTQNPSGKMEKYFSQSKWIKL